MTWEPLGAFVLLTVVCSLLVWLVRSAATFERPGLLRAVRAGGLLVTFAFLTARQLG